MDIFPVVVLVFCFLVSLFMLHLLANDDFVLLRKHVLITKVFDIAFLTFGVSLFSARLFYILFHFHQTFLNPLVFFLFPYFPGLSLGGGIIGGVLFLFLYLYSAKLPIGRIFDVFSLSLFFTLPAWLLLQFFASKKTFLLAFGILGAVFMAIFIAILLFRIFQRGKLKDGNICFISLSSFSFMVFITGFMVKKELVFFFLSMDDFLLLGIIIVSIAFLIRQEKKGIEAFFSQVSSRFR